LRDTEQVALLPDVKTAGLHDRLLSPSPPPDDVGGPPEPVGGGLLGGGLLEGGVLGGGLLGGGLLGGGVLGGGVLGGGVTGGGVTGGGPTKGLTEIAPVAPLEETAVAAGVAPIAFVTPTDTRLAAEEDNVTVMTATTPSEIGLAFTPEIRHTSEPGLLAHCTVLDAALAEGPGKASTATILFVS
jgi:hypothetical protein